MFAKPKPASQNLDEFLLRGAFVNVLGLFAKLIQPLLLVFLTWMFGPKLMGLYFLVTSLGEIATSAVTSGYVDAATIYGSHHADNEHEDESGAQLYQVLGNAFAFALGTGVLFVVGAYLGADALVRMLYPEHLEVAAALRLFSWSLPFAAFATIALGATQIRMRMEYQAVIGGFVRPVILLGGSFVAWLLGGGVVSLMVVTLVAHAVAAVLALAAFTHLFDLKRAVAATFKPKLHKKMLEFAIPQSLNMTLNRYITRLDVVLLAKFGHAAEDLAFYTTAALVTSNLREIKLIFSSALAPVAARYHGAGDRAAFQETLSRVARWTTTLVVPLIVLVAVLRNDVLRLVDASYAGDSRFMALLLVPSFLSCAYGLVANCVTYTGHSGWTLTNSAVIAILNTGFCSVLIPRYGLMGAAMGTTLAMIIIAVLQAVELQMLEKVHIRMSSVYKPHIGMLVVAVALLALWDPANLPGLPLRIAVALAICGLYAVVLYALRHEELLALLAKARVRLRWS